MQKLLGSWKIGNKTKEIIEIKLNKNGIRLSAKEEEEIQRAKNFKRYKEDHEDSEKADKDRRETNFL